MPRTALLGATGAIGERIAPLLVDGGHDLVLVGRDHGRLAQLQEHLELQFGRDVALHTLDAAASTGALRAALGEVDLAISALPVTDGVAGRAFDAALAGAVHLVDTVDVPSHLVRAYARHDEAYETGTVVVPGVGWRTAIGDLLASVAAERVLAAREVHAAVVVPERGGFLRAASPGVRRGIASSLGEPCLAFAGGTRVEERTGEERRLAWFPRPFGPHHAASIPGLEPLSVPRHLPQVQEVRSYLALTSPGAELLQATANLARWAPARRRLARRLERGAERWTPVGRPPARWAVVVEVEGEDGLARAWANGHDLDQATALLVAAVAGSVAAGAAAPGVVPPAQAGAPRELLDALAAASSIRWSVSRPRP